MKLPAWENMSGTSLAAAKRSPALMNYAPRLQAYTVNPSAAATRNVSLIGAAGRAEQGAYENMGRAVLSGIKMGADIYNIESQIDAEKAYLDYTSKAADIATDIKTQPNVIDTHDAEGNLINREYTWEKAPEKYAERSAAEAEKLSDSGGLRTEKAKRLFSSKRQAFDTRIREDMAMFEQTQWVSREQGELMMALQNAKDEKSVRDLVSAGYNGKILSGYQAGTLANQHVSRVYNEALTTRLTAFEQFLLTPGATTADVDDIYLGLRNDVLDPNLPITSAQRNALLGRISAGHAKFDTKIRARSQDANYISDMRDLWVTDRNSPEGQQKIAEVEQRMMSPGAIDFYGKERWDTLRRDMEKMQTTGQNKIDAVNTINEHIGRWWIGADGEMPIFDYNGQLVDNESYSQVDLSEMLNYISTFESYEIDASTRAGFIDKVTRLHGMKRREDVKAATDLIKTYYDPGEYRAAAIFDLESAMVRDDTTDPRDHVVSYIGGRAEVDDDWMIGSSQVDPNKPNTVFDVDVTTTRNKIDFEYETRVRALTEEMNNPDSKRSKGDIRSEIRHIRMEQRDREIRLNTIEEIQRKKEQGVLRD